MELAVIVDEISMEFEYALDVMLEYGVKNAELRGLWGTNIGDLSDEQAARAASALKSRGMKVCSLASPFFKCDIEGEEGGATGQAHDAKERSLDRQMELLNRLIELAGVFDTKLIRVFAFWKHGDLTEDIEKRIIEAFAEPVKVAEKAGVILALENEHACYLGTGIDTARVLKAVNSPALKAVWDPGNAVCAGENAFPDGYEAIKEWIVHVHIKDPIRVDDHYQFARVGDGMIDYMAQFRALKADGYDDCLSLETHYRPDGNSELGTRQCLESLREMLTKI